MATPDTIVFNAGLVEVSAGNILVTNTLGVQQSMATALSTSTGGAVSATTLSASAAVSLNPANAAVSLAPTGTGVVTINPATAGTMDNVAVGATTPLAVHATTLTATGAVTLSNATVNITALGTVDPHVLGQCWLNSRVLTVSAG